MFLSVGFRTPGDLTRLGDIGFRRFLLALGMCSLGNFQGPVPYTSQRLVLRTPLGLPTVLFKSFDVP